MKLARVVIEHIAWLFLRRCLLSQLRRGCVRQHTFPGGIVDLHARLDVKSIDTEANPSTAVFNRVALHENTARKQVIALENRRRTIEHMVAGLLHIVRDLIFKRQHPFDVQIPRTGDQIALIRIFRGQLVSNQMTAIVQIFTIYAVIFDQMPAARFDGGADKKLDKPCLELRMLFLFQRSASA